MGIFNRKMNRIPIKFFLLLFAFFLLINLISLKKSIEDCISSAKLDSKSEENYLSKDLHEIKEKLDHLINNKNEFNSDEILTAIESIKTLYKDEEIAKNIKDLKSYQRREDTTIVKTFRQEINSQLRSISENIHSLMIKNKFIPQRISDKKILAQEMTEILKRRDEKREAVYFTETSGTGFIKPRFVCAVESAAMAYPNADIYVIFAYLPENTLYTDENPTLNFVLQHHSNIHILYVDFEKLFIGTPLEKFYQSDILKSSLYLPAHTSDVIRTLTLWLFGGKYFDLDIIIMKNLTENNFIIQESLLENTHVANCAYGFEKGSPVGRFMLELINKDFDGSNWAWNGPRVITLAMRNHTGVLLVDEMNDANLGGFKKLKYDTLFAIEYFELLMYFDADKGDEVLRRLEGVEGLWGVHIGNNLVKSEVVKVGSEQGYSKLAQTYCPRSFWSCHEEF